ncbi:sodium/calcium exchanger NCL2-like isoform X2 [Cornus florida]|uniref:sodium/calcium exchanger NCL2-like isoform X2 n=1 Tax=Cornus florida TaxID=4283 RepID=UPI00289DCA66|nr:sodium/calcium exchanger NCL2-like isoform X2 [Cornus florida]
MIRATLVVFFLLLVITSTHLGYSRLVSEKTSLVSDGIGGHARQSTPIVELKSTVTCEPTYGFLPCTTEIWGQLFLIVVYEYLLFLGDQYVAAGSELFFKIIGPGIFGASLFQVLGTIPVVVLMLVSGVSASYESVQEQAAMRMSLLAGAAVMQLTLVWGSCVAFGSFDISETSTSSNTEQKKPFSLTGLGVKTDADTSKTAKLIIITMVPFLILQLSKILNSSSGTRITVLVTLIVTLALLFVYCFYQVFQPWIQNRQFEYLMLKYVKNKLLKILSSRGKPNVALIKEIFHEIDKDNNAYISRAELRGLILGIQLQNQVGLNTDNTLEKVMEEFDSSGDARIEEAEFVRGISKYISDAKQSLDTKNHNRKTSKNTGEEGQGLVAQKEDTTPSASVSWWTHFEAAFQLLFGTAILLLLAQPLIETVADFATSANISSFYVSYVVIPLAMNYRMAMGTIKSARQKTQNAISLTLSKHAPFLHLHLHLLIYILTGHFCTKKGFCEDDKSHISCLFSPPRDEYSFGL